MYIDMLNAQEEQLLELLLKKREPTAVVHKSVRFTNWTEEDFTFHWDSVAYTVKAHESMNMEDWKARHAAKYLAERELNNENKALEKTPKEQDIYFTPKKTEYMNRCFGETIAEASTADELGVKMMNLPAEPVKVPAKRGRPPVVKEEEFPDLNEATTKK